MGLIISIESSVRLQQGLWLFVTSNVLIAMTSRVQLRWPSSLLPVWQCHSDTGGLLREFQMLSLSFDPGEAVHLTLSPMPSWELGCHEGSFPQGRSELGSLLSGMFVSC